MHRSPAVFVSWVLSLAVAGLGLTACSPDLGLAPFLCNSGAPKCPSGYVCNAANYCVMDGECPPEVPGCGHCGDGKCDEGEDFKTCEADCPATEDCGNGTCDEGEDATSCPQDCKDTPPPPPPECGNNECEAGENPTSCPQDCGLAACTAGQQQCKTTITLQQCNQGQWVDVSCTDLCARDNKLSRGCTTQATQDACDCYEEVVTNKLPYGSLCSFDSDCNSGKCMPMQTLLNSGAYCSKTCTMDSQCPDYQGTSSVCSPSGECMVDCAFDDCPSGWSCSEFFYDYKCIPW